MLRITVDSTACGKIPGEFVLYQGTTLQAAEKLDAELVLYQGTTLVVPPLLQNTGGL